MMRIFRNVGLVVVIFIFWGCVNIRHDVSKRQEAWGLFHAGSTYSLIQDVFLIRVDSGLEPSRLALVPPSTADRGSGFYSSPQSVAEYEKDPVASTHIAYEYFTNIIEVVGIIRQGTQFTPRSVKRNSGWNLWFGSHTDDTIYGEILTGAFKGTVVDLGDVSWGIRDQRILNQYIRMDGDPNQAHEDIPLRGSPEG